MRVAQNGLRRLAAFARRTDAHPVAGGSGEVDDLRVGVVLEEISLEAQGFAGAGEGSDLDGPATALGERLGRAEDVDADGRDAGKIDAGFSGCGAGEIEDASWNKGAAVGDVEERGLAGFFVGDADQGVERQGAMGGGDGVLVVDLPVGGAMMVVLRAVPACHAVERFDGRVIGGEASISL